MILAVHAQCLEGRQGHFQHTYQWVCFSIKQKDRQVRRQNHLAQNNCNPETEAACNWTVSFCIQHRRSGVRRFYNSIDSISPPQVCCQAKKNHSGLVPHFVKLLSVLLNPNVSYPSWYLLDWFFIWQGQQNIWISGLLCLDINFCLEWQELGGLQEVQKLGQIIVVGNTSWMSCWWYDLLLLILHS